MAVPANESFAEVDPAPKCKLHTGTIESIEFNGISCCSLRCNHVIGDKTMKTDLFELRVERRTSGHDQDDF
ncbi:MAG: hypothetical protein HN811_00790 [Phycisphaerae bacterium]|nr:hypothetical protein [Phycisphaerae bacterium]